jgi:hypothetical protein
MPTDTRPTHDPERERLIHLVGYLRGMATRPVYGAAARAHLDAAATAILEGLAGVEHLPGAWPQVPPETPQGAA